MGRLAGFIVRFSRTHDEPQKHVPKNHENRRKEEEKGAGRKRRKSRFDIKITKKIQTNTTRKKALPFRRISGTYRSPVTKIAAPYRIGVALDLPDR
jgi:hypothetical protein